MPRGMAKLNRSGEIKMFAEGHFEWRIPNFHYSLSQGEDPYILEKSPNFTHLDSLWSLEIALVPTITSSRRSEWVSFRLIKEDRHFIAVKVTASFKKMDGTEQNLCDEGRFPYSIAYVDTRDLGKGKIVESQSTLESYSGPLLVTITINRDEHHSLEGSQLERLLKLSNNLQNTLSQGENTDVVIKLKTREIPAHRAILKARSTFFKTMLESDVHQNRSSVIELMDDDEDAFHIVLSYIYCGKVKKLNYDNVLEVYKIAHKYDLQELKKLCSMFMTKNMRSHFVCDAFAMSKLYEDAELNSYAKYYFSEHLREIVGSEKWTGFKREKPELVIELFEWSVSQNVCLRRKLFGDIQMYIEEEINREAAAFVELANELNKCSEFRFLQLDDSDNFHGLLL